MTLPSDGGSSRVAAVARWGGACLLIAAAHAGAGWWVLTHPIAQSPPDTVQGIPIDLEPVAVSQNSPEPNTTTSSGDSAPAQEAATPEPVASPEPAPAAPPEPATTPPPPEPPPPEPPQPEPPPPPAVEPPLPPVEPSPPVVEPPPPEPPVQKPLPVPEPPPVTLPEQNTKSDAVLAPPAKPRPVPPKPDPRQVARDVAREAARKKAIAARREEQRAARAEAQAQARVRAEQARDAGGRAPQNAAPSSASSGASVSTWRGAVVAHLNAFKPASPNGANGSARVAFAVDRTGRVVSASLVGSSGDAALDSAAVAMVRRASPVPAPPAELGGRIALTVPVYFH